ncbi:class I SAM-dependent methyltransferase [Nonomuraea sp. NPDC023979]|uniref:class I SAM-dependent methyltransferase n=1 Tax=Nonomuraea sp. NPDC023979 TaxID=3154796 RepID=UPI0033FB829B
MRNGSGVDDHQHAAQTLGHPGERVRHAVGLAIAELARLATRGHVYGVDHSQVMVGQARRRNAAAVRAHRVHLTQPSVDQPPGFDHPLDAILAVNSLGFWPNPVERLRRLRGLLRPGGRIALVGRPRYPGADRDTTGRATQELQDLLTEAGFAHPRVEVLDIDPPAACLLADNPTRMPS